jgi:signal transduction histidine kinase
MTSRPTRARWRERIVLAGGLLSTISILWAAFDSYGDPRHAGESRLARLAGEVSDGIVAEWERIRRSEGIWNDPDRSPVHWITPSEGEEIEPFTPREWTEERAEGYAAFDALLGEANRLERREDDPEEALEVVLEALTKECGPPRIAEGRLRAIQLARRLERADTAREQWRLAGEELDGSEAREGIAYLLLDALAVEKLLDGDLRLAARERIADLWSRNRLALPGPPEPPEPLDRDALAHPDSTLRETLREMVQRLGAEPDPRLERAALEYRGRLIGRIASPLPPSPADGGFAVGTGDRFELIFHETGGVSRGIFLDAGHLTTALARRLDENGLLPEGFAVDFEGGAEEAGEIIRASTALPRSPFAFLLRHPDPDTIISAEASRVRILRAALILLALFTGGAAFTTVRILRRERALAHLKTSFVANVSHELRTPLSSILLMAENLERGLVKSDETRSRYHALIRREAQRLRRLVDDVLDFSRVDRGEVIRARIEEVNLERFASELASELHDRLGDDAPLDLRTEALPGSARFDEEAIRRALFNLVDNAAKYGEGGAIEVSLGAATDGTLRFGVRDHGPGVERARREEIFEAFARIDRGREASTGTGLGLAIVREITRAHGGSVHCSEPDDGSGALFEIVLPPIDADETMEEA